MKEIVALSALRGQLTGIALVRLADATASIAGTHITSNQITNGASAAGDSYPMEVPHPDYDDCRLFA